MDCRAIETKALMYSGFREIPDAYVLSYINDLMSELAIRYDATAAKKKIIIVEGIKNEWIDLPNDCLSVKRCFIDRDNYLTDDFLIENGQIQFFVDATYRIECITSPSPVTKITDVPEINLAFHEALAYGVAFKESNRIFMHEDMFEGNNKFFLIQEYNRTAREANDKLLGMKKSRRRIKFSPFY